MSVSIVVSYMYLNFDVQIINVAVSTVTDYHILQVCFCRWVHGWHLVYVCMYVSHYSLTLILQQLLGACIQIQYMVGT